MLVRIESIQPVASNVLKLKLVPATVDVQKLPEFVPGAHIEIHFANGQFARRYTLISDPDDLSFYEIAVLKVENGSGGSKWLHETLKVDDVLVCVGPFNEFNLASQSKHSVLIAGGIGVTPILSFVRELQKQNQSFELHYAARNQEAAFIPSVLQNIKNQASHFYFNNLNQKLELDLVIPTYVDGHHLYICGPAQMIEHSKSIALKKQWLPNAIHFESFGQQSAQADSDFSIELERSGQILNVGARESILEALERNGIRIDYGCRRGECGACVVEYLEGDIDHRDVCLTPEERRQVLCACVSRSKNQNLKLNI